MTEFEIFKALPVNRYEPIKKHGRILRQTRIGHFGPVARVHSSNIHFGACIQLSVLKTAASGSCLANGYAYRLRHTQSENERKDRTFVPAMIEQLGHVLILL